MPTWTNSGIGAKGISIPQRTDDRRRNWTSQFAATSSSLANIENLVRLAGRQFLYPSIRKYQKTWLMRRRAAVTLSRQFFAKKNIGGDTFVVSRLQLQCVLHGANAVSRTYRV